MAKHFMGGTRPHTRAQRSGSRVERSRSEMSEPCRCPLRRGEGYGACGDEMMDPSRSVDPPRPVRFRQKGRRPQPGKPDKSPEQNGGEDK